MKIQFSKNKWVNPYLLIKKKLLQRFGIRLADERIKSLDEKYEKWSGSRALSAAGSDALAKLDASASERFRFRHKLLDLDLKELQPSDIVKSVMAKRSVFDEDSKRLENVGEKYEPCEFGLFSPRTSAAAAAPPPTQVATSVPASPQQSALSASTLKVNCTATSTPPPKTATVLSPRSSGKFSHLIFRLSLSRCRLFALLLIWAKHSELHIFCYMDGY